MSTIKAFISILFFCLFASITCSATYFHKVPAKKGDSIYKLLKRYYLTDYECNYDKFFQLNKLKPDDLLIYGKEYFLPVYIYAYDSKSIKSTLNITEWEKSHRIKEYNEFLLRDGLRKKTIVDSKILWVPYNEFNCEDQKITITYTDNKGTGQNKDENIAIVSAPIFVEKGTTKDRHFTIFGEKFAYTPLTDNKLKGKIFYIVSGHGGPDPGAITKRGGHDLCEDEYAYDVALRLTRNLISHGAIAYMITRDDDDGIRSDTYLKCDTDERYWGTKKQMSLAQKIRLRGRSGTVNRLYEKHSKQGFKQQYLLAIHIDSRNSSSQTDMFFYYYPGSKSGKKLAKNLQSTIKNKYKEHAPGRDYFGTVTPRNLHMLRETKSTNIYLELGNIMNPKDQKRFILASNRQALADWLADGFMSAK